MGLFLDRNSASELRPSMRGRSMNEVEPISLFVIWNDFVENFNLQTTFLALLGWRIWTHSIQICLCSFKVIPCIQIVKVVQPISNRWDDL